MEKGALGQRGEALAVEMVVGALEGLGELLAPQLHLGEELLIDGPGAAGEEIVFLDAPGELWQRGGGFVEGTGGDIFFREEAPRFRRTSPGRGSRRRCRSRAV